MEEKDKAKNTVTSKGVYTEKIKSFHSSIKEHLNPAYQKQYNVRRFIACVLVFLFLRYMQSTDDLKIISTASVFPFIWAVTAFLFWHYSYWRFQGGVMDTFSRNIVYFGSIWSLIWKIIVQNIVIQIWIALIAPISGIKTWRKAVKHNKILFVENNKYDEWN
ncbi:hypothetical protein [Enterococcus sp. DIV0187]|uniref:hypothetical protein n=1 Tax=Enterococcus sp. DIV0187 TaxID=2774644 RepID=UPI003F28C899